LYDIQSVFVGLGSFEYLYINIGLVSCIAGGPWPQK